jgi:hypothetical protein
LCFSVVVSVVVPVFAFEVAEHSIEDPDRRFESETPVLQVVRRENTSFGAAELGRAMFLLPGELCRLLTRSSERFRRERISPVSKYMTTEE